MYFVTSNPNKFAEFKRFFPGIEMLNFDVPEIQGLDAERIIAAKLDAAVKAHHQKLPLLVEDTSLYVTSLGGMPGPLVKWWLEAIGPQGVADLVLRHSSDNNATAVTIIGMARQNTHHVFFRGSVSGSIVKPSGDSFGWDGIFLPVGHTKTMAEMDRAEKDRISMRGRAANELAAFLDRLTHRDVKESLCHPASGRQTSPATTQPQS